VSVLEDLFHDDGDEEVQTPSHNTVKKRNQNLGTSLFKRKEEIRKNIGDIQSTVSDIDNLFTELGDGRITDDLSIKRRNEIINTLEEYHQKIEKLNNEILKSLNKDIISVRGLKATSSTNPSVFDELLGNTDKTKLTSKDISFQRRED
jgi:signal recognition particle GTPase